jgi:hypothetical protein
MSNEEVVRLHKLVIALRSEMGTPPWFSDACNSAADVLGAIADAMETNTPSKVRELFEALAFKVEYDGKPFVTVFRQIMPYELVRDALSEVGLDIEQMKVSIR